jgi:hypothetical protein
VGQIKTVSSITACLYTDTCIVSGVAQSFPDLGTANKAVVPKVCSVDPNGSRPVPRGSVDTFL